MRKADPPPGRTSSTRWFQTLLRLYPKRFRARFGRQAVLLFEDRYRDAAASGRFALVRLWVGTSWDVVVTITAEYTETVRERLGWVDKPRNNALRGHAHGGTMQSLVKDFRYAARMFVRNPGFTAIAVLTLGLGIGANTAIFSVVRAVLLAPLPYDDPERLTLIWAEMRNRNIQHFPHSPPDLRDLREANSFEDIAGFFSFPGALAGDGEIEQVQIGFVTTDLFPMLGVAPLLGRSLEPGDDTPFNPFNNPAGAAPPTSAVILSHGLWQRRFGADPDAIGRSVRLAGGPAQIVGVMPADFEMLLPPTINTSTDVDLWTAARLDFEAAPRGNVFLILIGRLNDGVSLAQANGEIKGIGRRIRDEFQVYATAGYDLNVVPLHEDLTRHVRPTVLALLGAVGFVLLIACVNVANLLLVRATVRAREISVRAALGGSRLRLVRQMLAESTLLAVVGGAVGLLFAQGGIQALLALKPEDLPRIETIGIDAFVLAFTIGASIVAAIVFGTMPAIHASRANLTDVLGGRSNLAVLGWQRHVRSALVVAEVALSLVLMIGTGLMVRSFVELQRVEPGFDPDNLLTLQVPLPFFAYAQATQRAAFYEQFAERTRGLPGVLAVGGASPLPLSGQAFNGRYGTEAALEDERNYLQADYRAVFPGYFEAMRTRILDGRTFATADASDSLSLVLVDEVLAGKTWPNQSAVGKRLLVRATSTEAQWVEVIGVVEHQRHGSLSAIGRETIYFTHRYLGSFNLAWTIRTQTEPTALVNAIRAEVAQLDPNVPVSNVRTMESFLTEARAPTQFALVLIAVFGTSALVLASVGLYGVLSYLVRQRTAEIGVRIAFGAQQGGIVRLVVGQGLTLAFLGVGIGIIAAVGLTRLMSSMLVGVTPTDPLTFGGIAAAFAAVAVIACYVPARRATRVDPVVALRSE